ncbi:MAG: ABC transporter substrate-binding protein [Bacteroidota bacterium]|nr:ABC transporter substrate-binding protein [Bacteroidota bacterium]
MRGFTPYATAISSVISLMTGQLPMGKGWLLVSMALLWSCARERPAESLRPAVGDRFYGGTYRVNEVGEVRSLDPVQINDVTSAHVADQIYDKLLTLDENLRLQPELADRWEISPDGLVYRYYLRRGVYFHDHPCFPGGKGREVTAEDVRYSFTRACDFRTGTLVYDYFRGKVRGSDAYFEATRRAAQLKTSPKVTAVDGFVVRERYVFEIHLTRPFTPFEYYASMVTFAIVPREAVEYYGTDFFRNPVGSGPFVFVSWSPDRELVLRRNPQYWQRDELGNRMPYLDAIRFSFIKDDKTQLLEFRQGNLEECYRIPAEFFPQVVNEQGQLRAEWKRFQLLRVPALATQYYGMLTIHPLFRDRRVRQALSYAVDRERIVRYVLKGQAGEPGHYGLIPPSLPDYPARSIRGYRFDPERARQLLSEAGYPNGRGFPRVTLQLNAGGGRNVQVAEAVQAMLRENLGIEVELRQVEFAQHLKEIDAGRVPFFRLGWVADYPEPENFLNLFYGKLVPENGTDISPINSTRYRNPAFDALLERALATQERRQRMELYRQAEQIALDDAPMIVLFYDEDYRLLQPYVAGYRNNAMDRRFYKYVWLRPL